jgi:Carboxypeptidase regulatory-like domain
MRVPLMILALAAAPFAAAAAQGQAAVKDPGQCAVADAHRSSTSWSQDRPADPKGRDRTGCSPVAPAQDPPSQPADPPTPPPPAGTVSITGSVSNGITYAPLAGWVVVLTGSASATAVTDGTGTYLFSGLPAGTFTVCEQLLGGWTESMPTSGTACPTGIGYTFSLAEGQSGSYVNFWNVAQ